jgi:hypothetical protein
MAMTHPADAPDAASPAGSGDDPAAEAPTGPAPGIPAQRHEPVAGEVLSPASNGVGDAVARLTEDDLAPAERRRLIGQLAGALRMRGFKDLFRPKTAMTWLSDTVADVAPRIPIRTADKLRGHFSGLSDEQIIERLVRNASRATASIGAVGGGVAAIEWAAPPALMTAPVLLAAETVAVVAVEIKLIGELQEMHGMPVAGSGTQRAVALVQAWARRRGVNLMVPGRGMAAALGTAARYELRDRLLRRFGRNLTTLGPLLTGAAVAAFLNRRATQRLAAEVREDLSRQAQRQITDS